MEWIANEIEDLGAFVELRSKETLRKSFTLSWYKEKCDEGYFVDIRAANLTHAAWLNVLQQSEAVKAANLQRIR